MELGGDTVPVLSLMEYLRAGDLPALLPYLSALNALLVLSLYPPHSCLGRRLGRRMDRCLDPRLTSLVVVVVAHALRYHSPGYIRLPLRGCPIRMLPIRNWPWGAMLPIRIPIRNGGAGCWAVMDPASYLACDAAVHWAPLAWALWRGRRDGASWRRCAGSVLLLLAYAALCDPCERYATSVRELAPGLALAALLYGLLLLCVHTARHIALYS
jgi:hypothetical protein